MSGVPLGSRALPNVLARICRQKEVERIEARQTQVHETFGEKDPQQEWAAMKMQVPIVAV